MCIIFVIIFENFEEVSVRVKFNYRSYDGKNKCNRLTVVE